MDKNGWINKNAQPPTDADCDAWRCILVWHEFQGLMVMGVHNTMINQFVTHWRPSLPPPEQYIENHRKE